MTAHDSADDPLGRRAGMTRWISTAGGAVQPVTLAVVRLALGRVGPSEQAARDQLRRLGHQA
ncbi:hypothetical protein [Arthrobacter sp. V4I6]|uniref:hypothetical protein n=1 Tax=unclassified Arthrobacter TaxID=235627 RepID=UPI00359485E7